MSDLAFIRDRAIPRIEFDVAPVYNALCSICLLGQTQLDHISPWVDATLARATEEEREAVETACEAVHYVSVTRARTVESFIASLAELDPSVFPTVEAQRLRAKALRHEGVGEVPSAAVLASDREAFVGLIERLMEGIDDKEFDRAKLETYFDQIHDGEAYRDKLTSAISLLWDRYLKEEWERVESAVTDSVAAFQSVEIGGESVEEKLKFITQRDNIPAEWVATLQTAQEIVYVPSVHIGPYMILFDFDGTRAVVMGRARIPEGATVHSPMLDRSDLLIRLEALSDTNRLRILEMAASRDEITSQDVIDQLELSQSSASRHLTQLAATGLLTVDLSERTRRYRLNTRRIDDVCVGLKELFGVGARV
jgi:DNA-binding transcriptional ArsR family regulator